MEGNKDEAVRCIRIAEEAIVSGNKDRALKFIRIAQRLNPDYDVNELLDLCEKLDSDSVNGNVMGSVDENLGGGEKRPDLERVDKGESSYTEENVELISKIHLKSDYYAILGLEKSCSVDEIRRSYKKLSLKVHPDKNKAPGAEEAFKKVSKAFKCLSDGDSRRQYDQVGLVDGFERQRYNNVRRRRTSSGSGYRDFYYYDDFDADEVFRSFFGQAEVFRGHRVHRNRGTGNQQREEFHGGPNLILLLQILPFLLILVLAYLPFSEPDYSLHKNVSYNIPMTTEKFGVDYFVKSSSFEENFPVGSSARASIEDNVVKDYKNLLWRYCHVELQRRQWRRNLPTPNCNKLNNFGVA